MDKELARFYRERWKEVYEIEARERAALSFEDKFRQVCILFDFARAVAKPRDGEDPEAMEVWMRWARLKELYERKPKR